MIPSSLSFVSLASKMEADSVKHARNVKDAILTFRALQAVKVGK